jgi:hypothetical protein
MDNMTHGTFRWCWPKFNVYIPAEPRPWRAGLNRYPEAIIGVYVVAFGRCFGLRWKRS